jgi:hypothetical protein
VRVLGAELSLATWAELRATVRGVVAADERRRRRAETETSGDGEDEDARLPAGDANRGASAEAVAATPRR